MDNSFRKIDKTVSGIRLQKGWHDKADQKYPRFVLVHLLITFATFPTDAVEVQKVPDLE